MNILFGTCEELERLPVIREATTGIRFCRQSAHATEPADTRLAESLLGALRCRPGAANEITLLSTTFRTHNIHNIVVVIAVFSPGLSVSGYTRRKSSLESLHAINISRRIGQ